MARKWKLDDTITDVIKRHHDMTQQSSSNARNVVTVSNNLCKQGLIGESGNRVIEESEDLSDRIGVDRSVLEEAAGRLPEELDKAQQFLSLFKGVTS